MSDRITHECGVAMVRLLKPLSYYQEKYGSPLWGFTKLFLRTSPANTDACLLAEKCGFEIEGLLRKDYKTTSGELVDLRYYGLLNSQA